MKRRQSKSEGVSEAIGFLIMFAIVLTGIAMVSLVGYPMLLETQISSDERNMEQAMISVQNDMKIMTFSNIPYRDSTIRVSGGGLTAIDNASFAQKFTISDSNGLNMEFEPGAIQYESDDGTAVLTLMNGALVRREKFQDGSVMIAEPRWFYDTDGKTLVIYLTSLNADREYYERGIGTIQMSMKEQPSVTDLTYATPAIVTITYDYDPDDDYSVAWANYITGDSVAEGMFTGSGSGTYSHSYSISGVERLVVKEYDIKIENM
jgi:hypothetical protein